MSCLDVPYPTDLAMVYNRCFICFDVLLLSPKCALEITKLNPVYLRSNSKGNAI